MPERERSPSGIFVWWGRRAAVIHRSFSSCIRHSPFDIRNSSGGIAQLVERQLCKLDVRGSNPLASNYQDRKADTGNRRDKIETQAGDENRRFDWRGASRARVTIRPLPDHSSEPKRSFG